MVGVEAFNWRWAFNAVPCFLFAALLTLPIAAILDLRRINKREA
jgi:hypothetical protein